MTKLSLIILFLLAQAPILAKADAWSQYSLQAGALATSQNKVQLYQNGQAQEPLKNLISNANKFLFIELLSIDCDAATEPFIQLLESKAKQGAAVHLIVNKMYSLFSRSCLQRLEKAGVQIQKQKTHASYWINDQNELLIGSQSLARMFLLADGRNFLDRDLMAYAQGPVATEAALDFIEAWNEPLPLIKSRLLESRQLQVPTKNQEGLCFFLSEDPNKGLKSLSNTLQYWTSLAQKEIFFSGVKLEAGELPLTQQIRESLLKAKERGLSVSYLGNGPQGGNGELTMVLNEWIAKYPFFSGLLTWLRDLDSRQRVKKHFAEYEKYSGLPIFMYDQFLHYKVWNFDNESLLIGSANLADESFNKFYEAALFCRDKNLSLEWKKAQELDLSFAKPFKKK